MTRQPWVKTVWLLTAGLALAIIAVTALAYAYVGERKSDQAISATQADCPTWHDASVIPLAVGTTKQGLQLFADFRRSYFRLHCADVVVEGHKLGQLPPADKRLFPYLPNEYR